MLLFPAGSRWCVSRSTVAPSLMPIGEIRNHRDDLIGRHPKPQLESCHTSLRIRKGINQWDGLRVFCFCRRDGWYATEAPVRCKDIPEENTVYSPQGQGGTLIAILLAMPPRLSRPCIISPSHARLCAYAVAGSGVAHTQNHARG